MTAAFGTRKKQRLNRVMDALGFEYPNYERLDEEVGGAEKKRIVSILKRQAIRSIEKDKQRAASKKQRISAEPKLSAPKKRKSSTLSFRLLKSEKLQPWTLARQRCKICHKIHGNLFVFFYRCNGNSEGND